jgi:iron complex transport system permease protein
LLASDSIRRRLALTVALFGAFTLLVCLVAPTIGSAPLSITRAFDRTVPFTSNVDAQIFFLARLPRVLAATLVGAALALSGVVFQALLRNPLASPDTLGVSSGSAFGAVLAITFHLDFNIFGLSAVSLSSFAGALGALAVVFGLTTARRRGASTLVLLLAGVTLTALLSAAVRFVQYLADVGETYQSARWLMGSLDVGSYAPIVAALVPLGLAAVGFLTLPRKLDLMSVGAETAAARGLDVPRTERLALVSASLATGAAVAIGGPVGFVGIVVPHLVRLMVGADHRLVVPAAALFGGAFLVACDLAARTIVAPLEMPVGVVTAAIGGPFFLWLLFRQRV